jgi:hypothetical protein
MADEKVPYVTAYGNVTKALDAIQKASTPARFTQDFLSTKLALKGGSPKPVIPFLKRMGFLGSDGSPTDLYKRFRNPSHAGAAAASGLRNAFGSLYEINEYAHELGDPELRGLVVQATGFEPDSTAVRSIIGSFKAVKGYADFDDVVGVEEEPTDDEGEYSDDDSASVPGLGGLNLGYTINLHLPATSDIAVFNAIFKSLRENLLR